MKLISEYKEMAAFYDECTKEMEQRVKAREKGLTQLFAIIKEKGGEVEDASRALGSRDDPHAGAGYPREGRSSNRGDVAGRDRSKSVSRYGPVRPTQATT